MALTVKVFEHKYPRKDADYSVWVMDGDKKVFCAHPVTDFVGAEVVAAAFRTFIAEAGEQHILDAARERY